MSHTSRVLGSIFHTGHNALIGPIDIWTAKLTHFPFMRAREVCVDNDEIKAVIINHSANHRGFAVSLFTRVTCSHRWRDLISPTNISPLALCLCTEEAASRPKREKLFRVNRYSFNSITLWGRAAGRERGRLNVILKWICCLVKDRVGEGRVWERLVSLSMFEIGFEECCCITMGYWLTRVVLLPNFDTCPLMRLTERMHAHVQGAWTRKSEALQVLFCSSSLSSGYIPPFDLMNNNHLNGHLLLATSPPLVLSVHNAQSLSGSNRWV